MTKAELTEQLAIWKQIAKNLAGDFIYSRARKPKHNTSAAEIAERDKAAVVRILDCEYANVSIARRQQKELENSK